MLIDNLRNDIYPEIKQYLIGENDPNEERFIKLETLNKFREAYILFVKMI